MIIAVIYEPVDGRIVQTATASRDALEADSRPFLEVEEFRFDYDMTHRVVDGQLVEIGHVD